MSGYDELTDEIVRLHATARNGKAVALLDVAATRHPDRVADLAHLAACVDTARDDPDAALARLERGLDAGAWWHERILLDDDDLAVLRGNPRFEAVAAESRRRAEQALPRLARRRPVVLPAEGSPTGALVALHGARLDVVPDLGHACPGDFADRLVAALTGGPSTGATSAG
jgi:hypothetical protein